MPRGVAMHMHKYIAYINLWAGGFTVQPKNSNQHPSCKARLQPVMLVFHVITVDFIDP